MPSMVFPHPALPHTSVGRPVGSPPPVISSRPVMPVGDLRRVGVASGAGRFFVITGLRWDEELHPQQCQGYSGANLLRGGAAVSMHDTRPG